MPLIRFFAVVVGRQIRGQEENLGQVLFTRT
jgi:hypothetical protein